MRRNLVASLFEHETISTTMAKAKDARPFAEKLITLAKKGTLSARRQAIALLGNRDIISYEEGKTVKKGTIIGKLFSELGPRYLDRPGGYTRIIRLPLTRLGDNGQLVLLQLIGEQESPGKQPKAATKRAARRRAKQTVQTEKAPEDEESTEQQETTETKEVAEAKETSETEEKLKSKVLPNPKNPPKPKTQTNPNSRIKVL
jgi:large subunit ribosomal protein L17